MGCFLHCECVWMVVPIQKILYDETDTQHRKFGGSLDDGRTSSSHSHSHYQTPRRSPGNSLKQARNKQILIDTLRSSRSSLKSNGEDADILQQLLIE